MSPRHPSAVEKIDSAVEKIDAALKRTKAQLTEEMAKDQKHKYTPGERQGYATGPAQTAEELATKYMQETAPVVPTEERGAREATIKVIRNLASFKASETAFWILLIQWNRQKCKPSWDSGELVSLTQVAAARTAAEAEEYAKATTALKGIISVREPFSDYQESYEETMPMKPPAFPGANTKATNPKDAVGIRKPRFYSGMSCHVRRLVSIGMMEGAMKYGRHNYRESGVRASVYYDSTNEHLDDWYEGEDIDSDSKLNHVIKAICSLYVLADAIVTGNLVDDRPPRTKKVRDMVNENQPIVDALFEKYPNPLPAYTELSVREVKPQEEK